MAEREKPKKVRVLITSPDGNTTHPFDSNETVGTVHEFGYKHLVQDKTTVPFSATWMEFKGSPIADTEPLAALASADGGREDKPDLTLALSWQTQGG